MIMRRHWGWGVLLVEKRVQEVWEKKRGASTDIATASLIIQTGAPASSLCLCSCSTLSSGSRSGIGTDICRINSAQHANTSLFSRCCTRSMLLDPSERLRHGCRGSLPGLHPDRCTSVRDWLPLFYSRTLFGIYVHFCHFHWSQRCRETAPL